MRQLLPPHLSWTLGGVGTSVLPSIQSLSSMPALARAVAVGIFDLHLRLAYIGYLLVRFE